MSQALVLFSFPRIQHFDSWGNKAAVTSAWWDLILRVRRKNDNTAEILFLESALGPWGRAVVLLMATV